MVSLLNGGIVEVHIVGTVNLLADLILKHVLYVPMFKCNPLSVEQLLRDMSCDVLFTKGKCVLQGPALKEQKVIGRADKNLFLLHTEQLKTKTEVY